MGGNTKTVLYQFLVLECFCILVSVQLNLTHTSSSDDIRSLHQELNTLRRDYNNVLSELVNIRKSLGTQYISLRHFSLFKETQSKYLLITKYCGLCVAFQEPVDLYKSKTLKSSVFKEHVVKYMYIQCKSALLSRFWLSGTSHYLSLSPYIDLPAGRHPSSLAKGFTIRSSPLVHVEEKSGS